MNSRPTILVVVSGKQTDKAFRCIQGYKVETILSENLRYHNLWGYTAVIIGSWTNDSILAGSTQKLTEFVNKGGILVCIGCQAYEAQWIPFCQWTEQEPANATWHAGSDDYSIIFRDVKFEYLRFHEFWGHGTIEPPTDAKVLARGDGRPLVIVIDKNTRGAILVTTIDPDFHAQTGVRTIDKSNEAERKHEARRLIENIFSWCTWKYGGRHSVGSFFGRRFLGLFRLRLLYFFFTVVLWPLSLIVTVRYFIDKTYDPWVAITGAASLIGLAIMITDKYIERRRM